VTPGDVGRPPAAAGRYPGPHPSGLVPVGFGDGGHRRPARSPGVHETGRLGRRPAYRPTVDPAPVSPSSGPRFLTLEQVAEELQVTRSQVYALVRDGPSSR